MSERELSLFIKKVSQLKELVDSLETNPKRRRLLAACESHDEVVHLAKAWGYEIARRWGEKE